MNDALTTALEGARSRLALGVEEAEAELARARARARELRDSLTMAREFAGIGSGIAGSLGLGSLDTAEDPHALSLRRRAALEVLRRYRRPARMWASFAPDVVLTWEGDSPFAGVYEGRKEALALLELVLRQIDRSVDPQPVVRTEGETLAIDVRPGLRRSKGVRFAVTAQVRFDEGDRIAELVLSPEEGEALDLLLDAVIATGGR